MNRDMGRTLIYTLCVGLGRAESLNRKLHLKASPDGGCTVESRKLPKA